MRHNTERYPSHPDIIARPRPPRLASATPPIAGSDPSRELRREERPAPAAAATEPEARTTADNARLVAALLAPLGARSVWIVTQPFHGRRAARLFRAAGLDAHVWHIADSLEYRDRPRALRWLAREYAAWLKHLARGGRIRRP